MSCSVCEGYSSHNCPCCSEGIRMVKCPDCHGTGKTPYLAYDMLKNEVVEVTESAWIAMHEEDIAELLTARGKKQNYFRYEKGGATCKTCHGCGLIPEDY